MKNPIASWDELDCLMLGLILGMVASPWVMIWITDTFFKLH